MLMEDQTQMYHNVFVTCSGMLTCRTMLMEDQTKRKTVEMSIIIHGASPEGCTSVRFVTEIHQIANESVRLAIRQFFRFARFILLDLVRF